VTEQIDPSLEHDSEIEALLLYLKETRAFDFTAYKRSTLQRRLVRRMETVGIDDVSAYRDFLEVHPEEVGHLFNTILINVTGFFRDPPVWDFVASTIIPQLLRSGVPSEGLRVWSAACASGEEAYTVAILLAEAMGIDAFSRHVKVYATDVDEHALAHARSGSYTEKQLEGCRRPFSKSTSTRATAATASTRICAVP
jgi:two-component system, chemotaxis family, CheB/CheR fusion protein